MSFQIHMTHWNTKGEILRAELVPSFPCNFSECGLQKHH